MLVLLIIVGSAVMQKEDVKKRHREWIAKKKALRSEGAGPEAWETWLEEGERLATEADAHKELHPLAKQIRDDMRMYESAFAAASMHVAGSRESQSGIISELARLRLEGLVSDEEFDAFTERFRRSTGARAREIIEAIEKLHKQHKAGAMTEGNYRASLWTLMDRLDSETKR